MGRRSGSGSTHRATISISNPPATPPGSSIPAGEEGHAGPPPGSFGGPITTGQVVAVGADIAAVVLIPVLNHYLEESYAEIRGEATIGVRTFWLGRLSEVCANPWAATTQQLA